MPESRTLNEPTRLNDPDMRGAEIAIQRAAKMARERARLFGHGIIVYENGKTVEKYPKDGYQEE